MNNVTIVIEHVRNWMSFELRWYCPYNRAGRARTRNKGRRGMNISITLSLSLSAHQALPCLAVLISQLNNQKLQTFCNTISSTHFQSCSVENVLEAIDIKSNHILLQIFHTCLEMLSQWTLSLYVLRNLMYFGIIAIIWASCAHSEWPPTWLAKGDRGGGLKSHLRDHRTTQHHCLYLSRFATLRLQSLNSHSCFLYWMNSCYSISLLSLIDGVRK